MFPVGDKVAVYVVIPDFEQGLVVVLECGPRVVVGAGPDDAIVVTANMTVDEEILRVDRDLVVAVATDRQGVAEAVAKDLDGLPVRSVVVAVFVVENQFEVDAALAGIAEGFGGPGPAEGVVRGADGGVVGYVIEKIDDEILEDVVVFSRLGAGKMGFDVRIVVCGLRRRVVGGGVGFVGRLALFAGRKAAECKCGGEYRDEEVTMSGIRH